MLGRLGKTTHAKVERANTLLRKTTNHERQARRLEWEHQPEHRRKRNRKKQNPWKLECVSISR